MSKLFARKDDGCVYPMTFEYIGNIVPGLATDGTRFKAYTARVIVGDEEQYFQIATRLTTAAKARRRLANATVRALRTEGYATNLMAFVG